MTLTLVTVGLTSNTRLGRPSGTGKTGLFSLRFLLVTCAMSKRSRSDSLDAATAPRIPRVLIANLKSETPDTRDTPPYRRATRGVESVPIDEDTDRNAVMQDTILRLHQGGRRVITDPIVL